MPRELVADCAACAALCCVAASFDRSEDFAYSKPAGVPCRYLTARCRCAIHGELVERGFRGCAVYDCHGAGQRVTRACAPAERAEAFFALRQVHEWLWMLSRAAQLCPSLAGEVGRVVAALEAIEPTDAIDLPGCEQAVRSLLRRIGAELRSRAPTRSGP